MTIPDFVRPGGSVIFEGERLDVVGTLDEPGVLLETGGGLRLMVAISKVQPAPITTADLLDEYAQALRGAWGGIDGRSEKAKLADLSKLIRAEGAGPLDAEQIKTGRDDLGICPTGGGHWTDFCDTTCNPEGGRS